MEKTDIDTSNSQLIGMRGDNLIVMMPQREMTKEAALRHAAWIVALADRSEDHREFLAVLEAIKNI